MLRILETMNLRKIGEKNKDSEVSIRVHVPEHVSEEAGKKKKSVPNRRMMLQRCDIKLS